MRGLSIVTNFEMSKLMFGLPGAGMAGIRSDLDFDYIEFLLHKYRFSKLCVSGGTDPLSNLDKKMNLEILRKMALEAKTRFFIYTRENIADKLPFIKYLCPSKLVVYNHLMADRNIDEIMAVAEICPTRLYLNYNNQHYVYVNLWAQYFGKAKGIEFCIKQNNKTIVKKEMEKLDPNIYVIEPGDYNYYLMPDNNLYQDFNANMKFTSGYSRGGVVK